MIVRKIITAEQREQLIELAHDIYERNMKLGGNAENEFTRMQGAISLIASAYSFYKEDGE